MTLIVFICKNFPDGTVKYAKSIHNAQSCALVLMPGIFIFIVCGDIFRLLFADSDQVMLQEGWLLPVVGREVFCPGVHLHWHSTVGWWWSLRVQVLRLGMFEVHCDELIRSLAKRADNLRNKLMVKMCRDHQEENKKSVEWVLCLMLAWL